MIHCQNGCWFLQCFVSPINQIQGNKFVLTLNGKLGGKVKTNVEFKSLAVIRLSKNPYLKWDWLIERTY